MFGDRVRAEQEMGLGSRFDEISVCESRNGFKISIAIVDEADQMYYGSDI